MLREAIFNLPPREVDVTRSNFQFTSRRTRCYAKKFSIYLPKNLMLREVIYPIFNIPVERSMLRESDFNLPVEICYANQIFQYNFREIDVTRTRFQYTCREIDVTRNFNLPADRLMLRESDFNLPAQRLINFQCTFWFSIYLPKDQCYAN